MAPDFISPADAFRIILRTIYPENPRLPARIKSKRYFESGQRKYGYLLASKWAPAEGTPPDHLRLPHEALRILAHGVREQKVELQGLLGAGAAPPTPINSADSSTGELDVFAETLAIGPGMPEYVYRRVWCSRTDVLSLAGERSSAALSPKEAAERAVQACYPDGVAADIVNAVLCRTVGDWIKKHLPNMPDVSDSTIKRAAGRKK